MLQTTMAIKNPSPMTNSRSAPIKTGAVLGEWAGVLSICPFSWKDKAYHMRPYATREKFPKSESFFFS